MFAFILCMALALALLIFHLLSQWTSKKQRELNEQEFRLWFQKNYLGVIQSQERPSEQSAHPSLAKAIRER